MPELHNIISLSPQFVLLGVSAGAIGTEANCDMVADTLHAINPGIKVMVLTSAKLVLTCAKLVLR